MSGASGQNYQCSVCKEDPERKNVWGCDGRTTMARPTFIDDDGTQYFSCPVRFIPDSVFHFIKIRNYHHDHPSAPFPAYDNASPRWLDAERIINSELSSIRRNKSA